MSGECLLVVDMLNDFLDKWEPEQRKNLINNTNLLIAQYRATGNPVIWITQAFSADLSDAFLVMRDNNISITIEGTSGAEIHADLHKIQSDITVLKKRYSAFYNTELEDILSKLNVERIALAGVNTHACVRMTAIDAYQRDIRVMIAEECVDSVEAEHGLISLEYMDGKIAAVLSNNSIIDQLTIST